MSYRYKRGVPDIDRDASLVAIFGPWAVIIATALILAAFLISPIVIRQSECSGFGQVTGREVQFRHYAVLSWDCFVRTKSGRWIPTSQLRDVVD